MDRTDEEIIEAVNSGTIRYSAIAKRLNIPLSTVHFRVKRLEREKIIKYYRAEMDWKKAGLTLLAFIYINVDVSLLKSLKKTQRKLLDELLKVPGVQGGYLITGDSDIMLEVIARDSEHLSQIILDYIDSKEGIVRTNTIVAL